MNHNHESSLSYGSGKIDTFQLRSHLKQKGYFGPMSNDLYQPYTGSLPKRKRQILKIINPETGDNIFAEIEKDKPSTDETSPQNDAGKSVSSSDNSQMDTGLTPQGQIKSQLNASKSGTNKTSVSPSMENVNNNRATMLADHNSFATGKMMHYGINKLMKPLDGYSPNILPPKFNNSLSGFHNMYYNNNPFYPPSEHLPHFQTLQQPSSQHFPQQPYILPYRNLPYYNSDVCFYPPLHSQGGVSMARPRFNAGGIKNFPKKNSVESPDKISENSSNESLSEAKVEKEVEEEAVKEASMPGSSCPDRNNADGDIKAAAVDLEVESKDHDATEEIAIVDSVNGGASDSEEKKHEVSQTKNDGEGSKVGEEEQKEAQSCSSESSQESHAGAKHLDPNAKSFIFNGVLMPSVECFPEWSPIECRQSRRHSNTGFNVDFVENERWIRKGSEKGHAFLGGVTSTPKLVRSESEGVMGVMGVGGSRSSEDVAKSCKSGRIQYSREFLLNLQYEPDSLKIPKDPISYPEIIQTGLHPHHMRIRMNKQQQCLDFNHSHFHYSNHQQHHNQHNHSHFNNSPQPNEKPQHLHQHQQQQQQQVDGNIPCQRNTSVSMPSVIDATLSHKVPQLNNHALMMLLNNNIQQQQQQQHGRHIKGKSLQQQQHGLPRKIIQVSLEKNVQLHQSNNAWKPSQKGCFTNNNNTDAIQPDDSTILDLYKKVRSILNKLTPQKFDTLIKQVHDLSINTEEKLKGCIKLIFEKAIGEPSFSLAYAKMAKSLNNLKVHMDEQPGETVTFRKLLLNQCQREFEKDNVEQEDLQKMALLIENASSENDRQQLIEAKQEAEKVAKRRSLGNIRFIGELFRLKMLSESIMYECISRLLRSSADEDNVECLCRLLTTIGFDLENTNTHSKQRLDVVFEELKGLAGRKDVSARVRFMLQDVLELRQNAWVPRHDDNQPKTIEQIHREAELEQRSGPFPQEKRSSIGLHRAPVAIQKRSSLDQHRMEGNRHSVGRGRSLQACKDEATRAVRAVVGCGSLEKPAATLSVDSLVKRPCIKSRTSTSEVNNKQVDQAPKVQPRRKTLEHKTPSVDADLLVPAATKSLAGSTSVDSLVTGGKDDHPAVQCSPSKQETVQEIEP